MNQHYRKRKFLPLFFLCVLGLCAGFNMPARAADLVPVLPQFNAFNPPRDVPDLIFKDKDGAVHKLSEYRGQLMLVNLWATWCLPCRAELPALDHLQTAFKKTGFRVIPISFDDPKDGDKIIAFFHEKNIQNLPIFRDPDIRVMAKLHPDGLPTSYLLTPDGKAVGMVEGIADWDGQEAANLIEAYLPKTSGNAADQALGAHK
jgi:thiol-disulfide isomerase/thioredoxin